MIESCAEKTYAATTITDIVARAHISRTTFYKHFDDKRACFDAAIDYCIDAAQKASPAPPTRPPTSRATPPAKAATAVLEALAARPGLAQLLTGDAIAVEPAGDRALPAGDDSRPGGALEQERRQSDSRTRTRASPSARPRS